MKEFIEELKYNQNINFEKGLENGVDITYVIERLEGIAISDELYDMLERAKKEDVLTIITMSLMYFTKKYGYSYYTTMNLVKKGYKGLERMKEEK